MNKQEDHKQIINQLSTFKTVKPAFSFKESLYREILSFEKEPKTPHIFVPFYNLRFAVIAVILFLFSATGIAVASQNAPYDSPLYPIKQFILETKISLTNDPEEKSLLNLKKSNDKVDEIKNTAFTDDAKLENATNSYMKTVENIIEEAKAQKQKSNEAVENIIEVLDKQEKTLQEIKNSAPEQAKPAIENAINASLAGKEKALDTVNNSSNKDNSPDIDHAPDKNQNNIPESKANPKSNGRL
jgi:hypothetical protein